MARIKSRMPQWDELTVEQQSYLADLDRVVPSREDLDGSASASDIVTAYNTLLEDLRTAGIMKRST